MGYIYNLLSVIWVSHRNQFSSSKYVPLFIGAFYIRNTVYCKLFEVENFHSFRGLIGDRETFPAKHFRSSFKLDVTVEHYRKKIGLSMRYTAGYFELLCHYFMCPRGRHAAHRHFQNCSSGYIV